MCLRCPSVVKPLKRRSKVVGKLALLLEMPTEVFTEVSHSRFQFHICDLKLIVHLLFRLLAICSPEDLLNLARTSPDFRELLMSKSSKRVWEAARTVQGIPVCPSDLSEPQYRRLAVWKGVQCTPRTFVLPSLFIFRSQFCPETRTRKTLYRSTRSRL